MEQNNIPTTVKSKPIKSKIMWLFFGLSLLLIFFFTIQFQDSVEYNHGDRVFQAYIQFTDPNYGIQPSDIGYSQSASISSTSGFLSMKIVVSTGLNSAYARQSFFSDTISFKEGNPKRTFDQLGIIGLHPFDSSIIETLKNSSDATLDVTFKGTYPLAEIHALGLKYKCFISWIASPSRELELFGFPGTNEFAIRELMVNALSYQDHLAGHQEFKASVRYAMVQGIFVYGIRVTGTSQDLLNLLNDRPVQSVEVIKINGKPVAK